MMVYQGSKNRLAQYIVPIIQKYIDDNNIKIYIEPFCGGANIIDKIECKNRIGIDINEDLIALLQYAQDNPSIDIAPQKCSFEHYKQVRADKNNELFSKEYRALIGYMASYGGRYYDGGYGRDSKGGRSVYSRKLSNFKKQAVGLKDISFKVADYSSLDTKNYNNCLFYMDPPYKDTKKYANQKIDYDNFYNFCRELAKNNIVLVSGYEMPNDFVCIWHKKRKVLQDSNRVNGKDVTEKLFVCGEQHKINE